MRTVLGLFLLVGCAAEPSPRDAAVRAEGLGRARLRVPGAPWGWAFEMSAPAGGCRQARRGGAPLGPLQAAASLQVVSSDAPVELEVVAQDCSRGTPQEDAEIVVRAWPLPMPRDFESVRVRILAPPERDLDVPVLRRALETHLDGSGLALELSQALGPQGAAAFSDREFAALDALAARAPARTDGVVDVILAGCLQHRSPVGGLRTIEAFVPRTPGAFEASDAIFIRGADCRTGAPRALDTSALAKLVAHELGHVLGLTHVEADNLMHAQPLRTDAVGLTDSQAATLRLTAAARAARP